MEIDQKYQASQRLLTLIVFTGVAVFVYYCYGYDLQQFVPTFSPENTNLSHNMEKTAFDIDIYKSLWDISNGLKNYWLYFRSIVNKTNMSNEKRNVDDGFIAINGPLLKIIRRSELERKLRLQEMSDFIMREIEHNQNPANCNEAKFLIATITRESCGFGCTLHTIVNYLIKAFIARRTFILKSKGWRYAPEGWEYAFLPLSNCTVKANLSVVPVFSKEKLNQRVLQMKKKVEKWIEWSVPSELHADLMKLHGHPFAWWISQFSAYVFRLQPWLEAELSRVASNISFPTSIVGIQVRWGDKIRKEAEKHEIEEYMLFVERWYDQQKTESLDRIVYLATEAAPVLPQLRNDYPNYTFIGNRLITSRVAARTRYRHEGLESVIADIYFLSRCTYLVCTLSSSVCRTAYELMMKYRADASLTFQSVDTPYRLKRMFQQRWEAVADHEPSEPGDLRLRKGDEILVSLNPHLPSNDGFLRGKNQRTKRQGKFPTFKGREKVFSYPMPTFQRLQYPSWKH